MATISNLTIASRNNGFTASGILDGISFNSIGVSDGQGLAKKWNRDDGPWKTTGSTELSRFAVNAVDIDWNSAQWPSESPLEPTVINTTGDLIKAIKWASTQGPTTELPEWTVAAGGPTEDVDGSLSPGGTFVVPRVSQNTSGQVTVTEKTFTLPQHTTITEDPQDFGDNIITGIKYDQYGHIISAESKEIISIYWNDNGATKPHEGGSALIIKNNKVELPTIPPRRVIKLTWNANGGEYPNWGFDTVTNDFEYTFKGWYTSDGIEINNNTIPSTNITYYAQWIASTSINDNFPEERKSLTRNGYTFKGWATTSTATTTDVTENTVPSTDVTYYAVWVLNDPYWYQGADEPTNPTKSSENTGLNKWTQEELIDSSNPTSIKFGVQDPNLEDHDWYFAVPTNWNFTKMSDVLGTTDLPIDSYEVTTKTINGIDYTVFHWKDATDAMYGTIQ